MVNTGSFTFLDWVFLCGYFLVLLVTGLLLNRRQSSTDEYFRAGGRIPVWAAAISLLATSLSAATFIGGPQQAYKGDLTYLSANIGAVLAIIIVAVYFIPAYFSHNVVTVYELLRVKVGVTASRSASAAFMLGRIFASGARLYIAALPASLIVFGDLEVGHQLIAVSVLTVIGIIYTLAGGIRSVIWTDVVQTIVFVSAAIIALIVLLDKIPVQLSDILNVLENPGEGNPSKLIFMRLGVDGIDPKFTYTLLTAIFGFTLLNLGAYGTDQDLAQRMLTTGSAAKGSKTALLGVLIGLPVTALFMIIGLLLYIFYSRPDIMGALMPDYQIDQSRQIFLSFILKELPPGVTGLMMAGLFAAALSSLNSALNALASAAMYDFYRPLVKSINEIRLVLVGRIMVVVFGIILGFFGVFSIFWQEARPNTTLIDFALMVMVFAYSGLVGVYLTALFTNRGNSFSVILALISGFISVVVLQTKFSQTVAFPWQMFIATSIAFVVCVSGRRQQDISMVKTGNI